MPSVSLCMIVRDEALSLPVCLESVADAVDEIVVVDTGSSDGTPEVARRYGARYYFTPWEQDFSKARNVSLDHATKDFVLVLDADEQWLPGSTEALREAFRTYPRADGFLLQIVNETDVDGFKETEASLSLRLFRNHPGYRFSGALHEQIAEAIAAGPDPGWIAPSDIRIHHRGYLKEIVKTKDKKRRNLAIAKQEFERHPEDSFRAFNLGVEYVRLKEWDQAIEAFEQARTWRVKDALWVSRFYKIYISTLMQRGLWDRAERELKDALRLFPDYTDLTYLLGVLQFQRQEWLESLQSYARCLEMGAPPSPPYTVEKGISSYRAFFALGQVYQTIGKNAEAAASYREAFQLNPTFTEAYERFAFILLREGVDPGTLEYLEQIAREAGEDPHGLIGTALAAMDHFPRAKTYLESTAHPEDVVEPLSLTYACLHETENLRRLLGQYDSDGAVRDGLRRQLLQRGLGVVQEGLRLFPDFQPLLQVKAEYERWAP